MKINLSFIKKISASFSWLGKTRMTKKIIAVCSRCWAKVRLFDLKAFAQSPIYRKIIWILGIFFVVLVGYVIAIGVMIYGFKSQSSIVKFTGNYVPYPIGIVDYQFVNYRSYLAESDYIHHFYKATQMDSSVDYKEIDQQIIDQLIENKIIGTQALKYKVNVTKQEEDQVINGIIEQNGGQDKVEKVLNEMYGINLNRFRQLVNMQILRDKLNEKVIAKITVRHILIRVAENASEEDAAKAKSRAEAVKKEIEGGLDFAEAAKKYSEDSSSAASGGNLDPFADGEMVQEFSDAAFKTKVGEISEPVKTVYGWHIIKAEGRSGILQVKFADWISELKSKSWIVKLYKI